MPKLSEKIARESWRCDGDGDLIPYTVQEARQCGIGAFIYRAKYGQKITNVGPSLAEKIAIDIETRTASRDEEARILWHAVKALNRSRGPLSQPIPTTWGTPSDPKFFDDLDDIPF